MSRKRGFTIVELLIVIVVIAILASISIVAYSGIQTRAEAVKVASDLNAVSKAIEIYYGEVGSYPSTSSQWYGYTHGVQTTTYVPGVAPDYISALPQPRNKSASFEYIYFSNGVNYKLIAHDNGGTNGTGFTKMCPFVPAAMKDPQRPCWAAGYWSSGGAGF